MKQKLTKRLTVILVSVLAAVALLVGGLAVYAADYYPADGAAIEAFGEEDGLPLKDNGGYLSVEPEGAKRGVILYPGGKVEHTAYVPLLRELARYGIFAAVVRMPMKLAVLDVNAAGRIMKAHPEVERWYVGGHSLGGAMAASYAKGHSDSLEGLILLGAYSSADISKTDLKVFAAYGSEDGVMNREKYEKYKKNLPQGYTELVISGGNHSGFGMYGEQKGDGTATVTAAEQIRIVVNLIDSFTKR